jgi:hypothetical protein
MTSVIITVCTLRFENVHVFTLPLMSLLLENPTNLVINAICILRPVAPYRCFVDYDSL